MRRSMEAGGLKWFSLFLLFELKIQSNSCESKGKEHIVFRSGSGVKTILINHTTNNRDFWIKEVDQRVGNGTNSL